jgi:heat shock protein HtpX
VTVSDPGFSGRVADNKRRAIGLIAGSAVVVGVVLGLVTLVLAGVAAAVAVFVVAGAGVAALAWWGSEPLAMRHLAAQPADVVAQARLFNLVEGLCANAGVPQPALYVVPDPGINALSMGRSPRHSILVVTTGLLDQLNRVELEAVLAHELSHIKSDDILTATVAVTLFGILGAPARAAASRGVRAAGGYLLLPLSALAGLGLRLAVDPLREEVADASGVSLTRYPPALVAALEKMQRTGTVVASGSPITAHLWLARSGPAPETDRLGWLSRLFETHPSLEERIAALMEL